MPLPPQSDRRCRVLRRALGGAVVACLIVAPAGAHAQDPERRTADSTASPAPPVPARRLDRQNVVSLQPLHAMFGAYSAEYERFVGALVSVAGAATFTDGEVFDWDDYADEQTLSTDLKLRFYPNGGSFHGLSIGLQAGGRREREYVPSGDPPRFSELRSKWRPAVGFLLEHGWLDRRTGRVLVAAGIGGRRVIRSGTYSDESYLTLRLSVGLAF